VLGLLGRTELPLSQSIGLLPLTALVAVRRPLADPRTLDNYIGVHDCPYTGEQKQFPYSRSLGICMEPGSAFKCLVSQQSRDSGQLFTVWCNNYWRRL